MLPLHKRAVVQYARNDEGATELRLPFHASNVQAKLRSADRGHVAAGSAANDDQVVRVFRHS